MKPHYEVLPVNENVPENAIPIPSSNLSDPTHATASSSHTLSSSPSSSNLAKATNTTTATTTTTSKSSRMDYVAVATSDEIEVDNVFVSAEEEDPSRIRRPSSTPSVSSNIATGAGYDGVFATMAAKPLLPSEKKEQANEEDTNESPPEYEEVVNDAAPPYFDTTIITALDNDEVLVEGLPVGSPITFFTTMLVSMSFQFVGFLLTYLLSITWAGRRGSVAGFGITMLHYGLHLRSQLDRFISPPMPGSPPLPIDNDLNFPSGVTPEEETALVARTEWLAYFLMLIGWLMVVRSCADYIRIRRMRELILSDPEAFVHS